MSQSIKIAFSLYESEIPSARKTKRQWIHENMIRVLNKAPIWVADFV